MVTALQGGTPEQRQEIGSLVSGYRAALNTVQQAQQSAGATTALLSADKSALLDPGGGPAIDIRRYVKVGTLADVLAVTGAYGDNALVTDLGTGGTGILVRWGSSGWRIPYDQPLALDTTRITATATTSEVVVKQVLLPAGFSTLLSGMRIEMGWEKSGTTAAAPSCRLRIGAAGTTADQSVLNTGALTAGNRSLSGARTLHFSDASTLQNSGAQSLSSPDFAFTGAVGAYPVQATINDTSATDTYISMCMQIAATTDLPGAYYLKVVGLS